MVDDLDRFIDMAKELGALDKYSNANKELQTLLGQQ